MSEGVITLIIYAVYIIKSDGRPIISEYFQSEEDLPSEMLLAGLVTALKGFSSEVLQNEMSAIEVEGVAYHIRSFGFYNVVLVTNLKKEPGDIIQEVGFRFMKQYGEDMLDKNIRVDKYAPFKKTIKDIIGIHSADESSSIKPAKLLSPQEIFGLPVELQPVAIAVLSIKEGTVDEIASETDKKIDNLGIKLEKLQNLGFVGTKTKNNQKVFFCVTFK